MASSRLVLSKSMCVPGSVRGLVASVVASQRVGEIETVPAVGTVTECPKTGQGDARTRGAGPNLRTCSQSDVGTNEDAALTTSTMCNPHEAPALTNLGFDTHAGVTIHETLVIRLDRRRAQGPPATAAIKSPIRASTATTNRIGARWSACTRGSRRRSRSSRAPKRCATRWRRSSPTGGRRVLADLRVIEASLAAHQRRRWRAAPAAADARGAGFRLPPRDGRPPAELRQARGGRRRAAAGRARRGRLRALPEAARRTLLLRQLNDARPLRVRAAEYSEHARAELAIFEAAGEMLRRYGREALRHYIIRTPRT